MRMLSSWILLAVLHQTLAAPVLNAQPVIAIVTEPSEDAVSGSTSYMAASYVKFIEMAGAQAAPLRFDATQNETFSLMDRVDGILFPGGGASLGPSSKFFQAASSMFKHALVINQQRHFPVWGTCLGFEFLNVMAAGANHSVLSSGFDSEDLMLPLNLTAAAKDSLLLGSMDQQLLEAVQTEPITVNMHQAGVSIEAATSNTELQAFFNILATNLDRNGREFVSVVEGKRLPVFATQFHPEKNNFEWVKEKSAIPHTDHAVRMSQHYADVFVNEARKDVLPHGSVSPGELIYAFNPVYTGKDGGYFDQTYYF